MDRIFKLPVGVAVFAALALAGLIGVFAFSATPPAEAQALEITYAENGMDPVATFTATDPEGDAITSWTLAPDNDVVLFSIANGVLRFKKMPNFEDPKSNTNTNVYIVTVRATDAAGNLEEQEVVVEVTNVDEPGKVTVAAFQPAVSIGLEPDLDDPDGNETIVDWQWMRSMSRNGAYADIPGDDAEAQNYTPTSDDNGYYLKVKVTYTDDEGADIKEASWESDRKVKYLRSPNKPPEFADEEVTGDDPEPVNADRKVADAMPKGTSVGKPVRADA
jgi:hypothetical protein